MPDIDALCLCGHEASLHAHDDEGVLWECTAIDRSGLKPVRLCNCQRFVEDTE